MKTEKNKLIPYLISIYSIPLVVIIGVAGASNYLGMKVSYFTRDPVALMHAKSYIGFMSNLGILLWCCTAAICLFTWYILHFKSNKRGVSSSFLLSSGLLTSMLMFDDLLLLHEDVFPDVLNIPQPLVYVIYIGIVAFYLAYYRSFIFKTDWIILFSALTFMAASVGIDMVEGRIKDIIGDWAYLVEDGFKFLGLAGWAGYYVKCSVAEIVNIYSSIKATGTK